MPTYDYFPFDSGLGANSTESRWREMMRKMKSSGVVVEGSRMDLSADNCAVSAGSGMQVQIAAGKAWVRGHYFSHTGTVATLAIGSNTSGSTRTDLVVLRCDFVNNTMGYLVLSGTITPVQNANQWDLPLATVAVPNNAVSAASFTFTDKRVFAAQHSLVPSVRRYSSATQTATYNGYTTLNLNGGLLWQTTDLMYPGTDITKVIIPQDGFYNFSGRVTIFGSAGTIDADDRRGARILLNNTTSIAVALYMSGKQPNEVNCSAVWSCLAGDYVQLQAFQRSTATAGTTANVSYCELGVHYLGPISVS